MVMAHRPRTILGLPLLTIFLAADAKTLGGFGLVYRLLPACRSESEPAMRRLYQLLPPPDRRLTTEPDLHDTVAGWAGWARVIYS